MKRWILRRILLAIPTLLGITLLVFLVVRVAPGDPSLVAAEASEMPTGDLSAYVARFRAEHLLDAPLWKQYAHFLGPFSLASDGHAWFGGSGAHPWHGVLALDFGREYARPDVPVASEIGRRMLVTAPLALAAAVLAFAVAIPLGAWSAARRGTRRERALGGVVFALDAAPTFWIALLLVFALGPAGLDWLPTVGIASTHGATSGAERVLDVVLHAVLPVTTLALASGLYVVRQSRSAVLTTLQSGYVRTARASGASEREALWRHAVPNALLPVVTIAGSLVPALLSGSVVVETVFGIDGLGRYAFQGMLVRDSNVILATTTVAAVLTLAGLLVADVAYAFVDPRIRHG